MKEIIWILKNVLISFILIGIWIQYLKGLFDIEGTILISIIVLWYRIMIMKKEQ